jgi:hypothetical protein
MNVMNVLVWFTSTPYDPGDAVRTTSAPLTMAITATMTLRIVLAIQGSLHDGGRFAVPRLPTRIPPAALQSLQNREISRGPGGQDVQIELNEHGAGGDSEKPGLAWADDEHETLEMDGKGADPAAQVTDTWHAHVADSQALSASETVGAAHSVIVPLHGFTA